MKISRLIHNVLTAGPHQSQAERDEAEERVHELQEELLQLQQEAHAAERRAELAERQTAEAHRLILDMQVGLCIRCRTN